MDLKALTYLLSISILEEIHGFIFLQLGRKHICISFRILYYIFFFFNVIIILTITLILPVLNDFIHIFFPQKYPDQIHRPVLHCWWI